MSEARHGLPERPPSDRAGAEHFQDPRGPARAGGYRSAPRHGAAHRTGSGTGSGTGTGTGERWPVADRRPPPAAGRTRRLDASRWHWLLLVPIVVPLVPGLYNRLEPTLFGLPFFIWSQLGFAFLASAVIAFVHLKVR